MTKLRRCDLLLAVGNSWENRALVLRENGNTLAEKRTADAIAIGMKEVFGEQRIYDPASRGFIVGAVYSEAAALGFDLEDIG